MLADDLELNLVESWEDALDFRRWLGERRPVLAVDTETGGLQWWRDPLRMVQFGDARAGWSLPWRWWAGLARDALATYEGELAMHNAKFDLHYLTRHGAPPRDRTGVHDTQTLGHLSDSSSSNGLKSMGVRYVDERSDQGQQELKSAMARNGWTWATVPEDLPVYWEYAALDTVLTAHLCELLLPDVRASCGGLYDLEREVTLVLLEMEERGIGVDTDYCRAKAHELEGFAERTRAWIFDRWDMRSLSNAQLAAALQRDGVVLQKQTPTGQWAMDEATLNTLDHELARAVLDVRKADKFAATYFRKFVAVSDEQRLHPSIRSIGTRNGRMAIGDGMPLQAIPRGSGVRNAFVPREGNRLISADFKQIEMRMLAHFSQDPGLIEAFGKGGDFFQSLADRIFAGVDTANLKGLRKSYAMIGPRDITKHVAYTKAYGGGIKKIAQTAGVDIEVAERAMAGFDQTFPGVVTLQHEVDRVARTRTAAEGAPYVTTPAGRKIVCEEGAEYRLVNYLLSGTAADVFKRKLVELDAAGLGELLVLPVHDEVLLDVPAEDAQDVMEQALRVMRDDDSFAVPVFAGGAVCERWSDLK